MFFDTCRDLNELKSAYKKLALENHPDCGGDAETMKRINAEYDRAFETLKREQNEDAARPDSKTRTTTEAPDEFKNIVSALLRLEGIQVELCGAWLWIEGSTFQHKAALKAAGCLWSASKKKWYWRHQEDGAYHSRGHQSMAQIRSKYGSEWLKEKQEREALPA